MALVLTLSALAGTPAEAVDATLDAFAQGAAARDTARVASALHPEARQFVVTPSGLQVIDRATYLAKLEAGALGGTATARAVEEIRLDGRRATARQVRTTGAIEFHDTVSLVQAADGAWLITSVNVEVVPRASQ